MVIQTSAVPAVDSFFHFVDVSLTTLRCWMAGLLFVIYFLYIFSDNILLIIFKVKYFWDPCKQDHTFQCIKMNNDRIYLNLRPNLQSRTYSNVNK